MTGNFLRFVSALILWVTSALALAEAPALMTCDGAYTLCATTTCNKIGAGTANCNCPIYRGKNVGYTTCAEREAAASTAHIYSQFSSHELLTTTTDGTVRLSSAKFVHPETVCPKKSDYQYADCFNTRCTINPDKTSATCLCAVKKTRHAADFVMESSSCDTVATLCASTASTSQLVANGAPASNGLAAAKIALANEGQMLSEQDFCH